jgi:hypothetical protein
VNCVVKSKLTKKSPWNQFGGFRFLRGLGLLWLLHGYELKDKGSGKKSYMGHMPKRPGSIGAAEHEGWHQRERCGRGLGENADLRTRIWSEIEETWSRWPVSTDLHADLGIILASATPCLSPLVLLLPSTPSAVHRVFFGVAMESSDRRYIAPATASERRADGKERRRWHVSTTNIAISSILN